MYFGYKPLFVIEKVHSHCVVCLQVIYWQLWELRDIFIREKLITEYNFKVKWVTCIFF